MSSGAAEEGRRRPSPRAVAIVPARLGSQRLPEKMLLAETGRHLFEHTARNVARCAAIERVVVATDDGRILQAARGSGLEAMLTDPAHATGTDRVREAFGRLDGGPYDVVVNVQGDEPELDPADLERLVLAFEDAEVQMATLCARPADPDALLEPQVVKVVADLRGDALYFSRSPVPFRPAPTEVRAHARAGAPPWESVARRHIGVYGFRPEALERFCSLPRGPLEAQENLEQLRWLESGGRIRLVEAARVPLGIDTRADYDAFVARARAAGPGAQVP